MSRAWRSGGRRRGAMLLESVAALMVLLMAMAATVRLIGVAAEARERAERRQFAAEAAANVLERVAGLPTSGRTAERISGLELGPEAARRLPGARLSVAMAGPAAGDPPGLGRVVVEVRWRGAGGRDEAPVRLTAWLANGEGGR